MNHGPDFSYFFDVGTDVLATTLDFQTGVLSCQTGDSTTQTPDADQAELWQSTGFCARPANPSVGNASCQCLVLKRSDRDIVFATRDVRASAIYGNLAPGEACAFATGGSQARTVWKADGSVTHITTDSNTAAGNSVFLRVDPTGVSAYSPNVGLQGDTMGWRMKTWHGARFTMGGLGLPAPFSALGLNSVISLQADIINLDAAVINMGRGSGQPVVQAAPMAATSALVQTALTLLATLITDICATPAVVGSAPSANPTIGLPVGPGDLFNTLQAITAAATALAAVGLPSTAGGTATNSGIA